MNQNKPNDSIASTK